MMSLRSSMNRTAKTTGAAFMGFVSSARITPTIRDPEGSQACPVTKVTLRPYRLFTRTRDARVYALKGWKRHFCHFSLFSKP